MMRNISAVVASFATSTVASGAARTTLPTGGESHVSALSPPSSTSMYQVGALPTDARRMERGAQQVDLVELPHARPLADLDAMQIDEIAVLDPGDELVDARCRQPFGEQRLAPGLQASCRVVGKRRWR